MLKLASNLSLPVDAVTQSIAILAKRRAGKSYTARRIAEELVRAQQQIVIVDPKGDWWGIRYAADGRSPGLPIIVLGGEHGDLPLEANAGEVIANLSVEECVPLLLDLSSFRKNEVATFMTGFLETFYRLKAQEKYRTPVMLVMDEADAIAPQKPYKGEERMLGATEDIVRRGGQRGIGCLLITQRSAVLNKNVLTQTQVLVAMRTIAPQDLAAMNEWVDVHGTFEERRTLMDSLPALLTGNAWFWSPGWPSDSGIFKLVSILPISTFDSGATPKPGEKRINPKNPADVDLGALRRQMAATIEKKKAEDPKELQRQVRELKAKLAEYEATKATADPDALKREYETGANAVKRKLAMELYLCHKTAQDIKPATLAALKGVSTAVARAIADIEEIQDPAMPSLDGIVEQVQKASPPTAGYHKAYRQVGPRPIRSPKEISSNGDLPKGERAILIAIAQYENGVERDQLMVLTGYKRSSRDAYLQRLSERGYLDKLGDKIRVTRSGIEALGGDYDPLPVGKDLQIYWIERLPEGERRVLEFLLSAKGRPVEKDSIDRATGYKRSSRDAYLQRLKARQLVSIDRGEVFLSEHLF